MRYESGAPALVSDLKIHNRMTVLHSVRKLGVCDANDITEASGLSRPTVLKCINHFLNNGVIVSLGKGSSTTAGGKRPDIFGLNPDRYFLSISLWPAQTAAFLFTIGRERVDTIIRKEPLPVTADETAAWAEEIAAEILKRHHIKPSAVCAASISTSGTVDRPSGTLLYSAHTPGWGHHVDLASGLRGLLGPDTPIFLENAGKMTARPFLEEPDMEDRRALVMFTTWGLSACLLEKGRILNGGNSLIGEIGHIPLNPTDPEPCGCGSHGCFERQVSTARVRKMLAEACAVYPNSTLESRAAEVSIPELFRASAEGDAAARSVVNQLAEHFARVLKTVSLVFDPDYVIFQGDYAYADDFFLQRLKTGMAGFRYFPENGPFEIRCDRRSLTEMDAVGAYIALARLYFHNLELYQDPPTTGGSLRPAKGQKR